jgi:hypothetical protein
MGIYRWAYLGPYAEFKLPLKSEKVDTCQRQDCPNTQGEPFCATCGMETKRRFHEYQDTDPPFGTVLLDHLKEALHTADGMSGPEILANTTVVYRLVPNVSRPGAPRDFHLEADQDLWVDITSLDGNGEIEWFKEAFASEWESLAKFYGTFTFKWGYLQWFS